MSTETKDEPQPGTATAAVEEAKAAGVVTDPVPEPKAEEADPELAALFGEQPQSEADQTTPTEATPAPESAPDKTATPAPEPAAARDDDQKMVPLAALAKEREARRKAEAEALFQAGRAAALEQTRGGNGETGAPAQAEPAPDRMAQIRAERQELAKKADSGEITMLEWEEQRQALEDEEYAMRAAQLAAEVEARAASAALRTSIAEETKKIEDDHPVVKNLPPEDVDLIKNLVIRRAAATEGRQFTTSPADTLELRRRIAEEATRQFGGGKPATPSPTPAATPAPLSDAAAARLKKVELQHSMPPDVGAMGSPATPGLSDAEYEARLAACTTEDEMESLMRSSGRLVRNTLDRVS